MLRELSHHVRRTRARRCSPPRFTPPTPISLRPAGRLARGPPVVRIDVVRSHSTASLHVGAAIPRPSSLPDEILAEMLRGAEPTGALRAPKLPVISARRLTGIRWCTSFASRESEVVIVEDDRFTYCARLEVRDATNAPGDLLFDARGFDPAHPAQRALAAPEYRKFAKLRRGALPARRADLGDRAARRLTRDHRRGPLRGRRVPDRGGCAAQVHDPRQPARSRRLEAGQRRGCAGDREGTRSPRRAQPRPRRSRSRRIRTMPTRGACTATGFNNKATRAATTSRNGQRGSRAARTSGR